MTFAFGTAGIFRRQRFPPRLERTVGLGELRPDGLRPLPQVFAQFDANSLPDRLLLLDGRFLQTLLRDTTRESVVETPAHVRLQRVDRRDPALISFEYSVVPRSKDFPGQTPDPLHDRRRDIGDRHETLSLAMMVRADLADP